MQVVPWSKTGFSLAGTPSWLDLDAHNDDAAAMAQTLLGGPFFRPMRHAFGDAGSIPQLSSWIVELIRLHDVMKAMTGFLLQESGPFPQPSLLETGTPSPHHSVALLALTIRLKDAEADGDEALVRLFPHGANLHDAHLDALAVVACHHGRPRSGTDKGRDWRYEPAFVRFFKKVGTFEPARFIDDRLARLAAFDAVASAVETTAPPRWRHFLLGFVNFVDWLSSRQDRFVMAADRGSTWDRGATVEAVLHELGWTVDLAPFADDEAAIAATLAAYTAREDAALRPPQQRLVDAIVDDPLEPGTTLVLEDETGGGKTLAALLVHRLLARRGLVHGLTFCLPTRNSAVGIHRQVRRVFADWLEPVVAVPGHFDRNSPLPGDGELSWAQNHRHRFLTAAVAVGTVDQVMTATMPLKYAHLKTAALSPNLLVIDEAHASDPYMRRQIVEVLRRHNELGGVALLLSATLPRAMRDELTAVRQVKRSLFARRDAVVAASLSPENVPYPSIARSGAAPQCLAPHRDDEIEAKTIDLELAPWGEEEGDIRAVAERALHAARGGARVLVIRNTVRLARATAEMVQTLETKAGESWLWRPDGKPALHHARFADADRRWLDARLLEALSPEPDARDGRGAIVVATQTVEQSLDIDADLLITDLVPIDVLLQRLGRLHRNRSAEAAERRPSCAATPHAIVLSPPAETLLGFADRGGGANWGESRAYPDTVTLAATRRLIAEAGASGRPWRIPLDNRHLVENGLDPKLRHYLVRDLPDDALAAAQTAADADRLFKSGEGGAVIFEFDKPLFSERIVRPFETAPKDRLRALATRLGERDVRLVLGDRAFTSPFGHPVEHLDVPAFWAVRLGLEGDAEPASVSSHGDGVLLMMGAGAHEHLRYDRFGLMLESRDAS